MFEKFERSILGSIGLHSIARPLATALGAAALALLVACGDESNPDAVAAFAEIEGKLKTASSVEELVERERAFEEALAATYATMRRFPSSEATSSLQGGGAIGELSIAKIEESLGQIKAVNAQALLSRAQAQVVRGREECGTYDCHVEALKGALSIVEKLTQKYWETETGAAIRTPVVIEGSAPQLPDLSVDNLRCMLATAEFESPFAQRLGEIRALEEKGDAEPNTTARLSIYSSAREQLSAIEQAAEANVARQVEAVAKPPVREAQPTDAIQAPRPVCEARSWTLDRLFRHKYKDETLHGVSATRLRDKALETMRMVTGSRASETRPAADTKTPAARQGADARPRAR
jgi:hypothetical protein